MSPPASSVHTPRTNNTPAASQFATSRSGPIPAERTYPRGRDDDLPALASAVRRGFSWEACRRSGALGTRLVYASAAGRFVGGCFGCGHPVLQLLEDAGAEWCGSIVCRCPCEHDDDGCRCGPHAACGRPWRVVAIVVALIRARGLFHHLTPPTHHFKEVGGEAIDDRLLKFFAKDFTKKTSVPLKVAPAASDAVADLRAEARLRLALLQHQVDRRNILYRGQEHGDVHG